MSEPLTVKVIGASGRMGREHAAAFIDAGARVVEEGSADVVSIASPDYSHADYVLGALQHGCHVFCEKPLCTDRRDYEAILRHVRNTEQIVWQHFPLRYQRIFRDLKTAVREFGDIYRVEASYNWGRTHKLYESWRAEDPDYSLVLGGMIHMIDLVQWVTGERIAESDHIPTIAINSVRGVPVYDNVTSLSTIGSSGLCVLTVDGGYGVKKHNHRLTVHGTKDSQTVVNHEPTDKHAAIRDFVAELAKPNPRSRGLSAASIAIAINDWIKSGED